MALAVGSKLGPYEILGAAGAGGMGEVYRARDTRLERTVAIKVLPEQFSQNPDLRQRFEREARAISSLNHPNICTLYDVGHQDGTDYLVLEYIEGETLSARLQRGPLPVEQTLKTGCEIAEALEKAHRQGIVHRDLKPGNVMLTKSGAKLLDFGLAKPQGAMQPGSVLTQAITQTSPASPITQQGTLVGTFQYMAPEQVEGKEADARSDIFALGAVLYEMATGKRAFEGKSAVSVASAILEKEPEPISKVQPLSPPALEQVVKGCLAKDPEERWQSAADVARQLRWISQSGSQAAVSALPLKAQRHRWERVAWAAVVVALLAAVVTLALVAARPRPTLHAEIVAPAGVSFDFMGDTSAPPVFSPDGTQLVFGAHTAKEAQALWVRTLATGAVQRLAGTDGAIFPFWSPDSRWIAFFADGKLKKMRSYGGPVADIADTPNAPRGGAWLPGDVIVYARDFAGPLWRVGASGGPPAQVTKLEAQQTTHRWPIALPDGQHFLYYATSHTSPSGQGSGIYYAALDGSLNKLVVASDAGGFYASGYLLYHQQNSLVAQRFDAASGTLGGDPEIISDAVAYDPGTWHLLVTASQRGTLAYQHGAATPGAQLTWMDRSGKTLALLGPPAGYNGYSISPDGKRVAAAIIGRTSEIYLLDVESGLATRLSFDSFTAHSAPSWSRDGQRVVYAADNGFGTGVGQPPALYAKAVNGSGGAVLQYRPESGGATWPEWSPDGRYLAFIHNTGPSGAQVEALPVGDGKPVVVAKPRFSQDTVVGYDLSRDGRWIAYVCIEAGGPQVYVSAFPSGSGRWQVSSQGGNSAVWSQNSDELFFEDNSFNLSVASYTAQGSDFAITGIKQLVALRASPAGGTAFDVGPDGRRFLVDVSSQESSAPLELVLNWTAELKK
ncbi:MAG TPA: protein kinase [Terriglobales bacterium]|nr:protein kinase [Terriglobales bacterium]